MTGRRIVVACVLGVALLACRGPVIGDEAGPAPSARDATGDAVAAGVAVPAADEAGPADAAVPAADEVDPADAAVPAAGVALPAADAAVPAADAALSAAEGDEVSPVPTVLPAAAAGYLLTFADEFSGEVLDADRWRPRSLGPRKLGVVVEDTSRLDGRGHLVMSLRQAGDVYEIAQVSTQQTFLQRHGYFECRARVNHELGAHTAFWLQSPELNQGLDDPARFGTEIDIFEYHVRDGRQWVFHNLHWNGYGPEHRQAGTRVAVPGVDQGFHTFGLLWTPDEYVFFVDGQETWRTTEAVSQIPQYLILSVELSGWGGDVALATLPDEIVFDHVRVFQAP